jgi:Ca-activated chloride channel homolog
MAPVSMMDILSNLVWREPLWLWLAAYPGVLWAIRGFIHRPRGRHYADADLMPWARARQKYPYSLPQAWRHVSFALAWVLFAMTMSGPRLPQAVYDLDKIHYPELMIILDLSRSMSARDVEPSRLERAKLELRDLIDRTGQLKIGLMVYAARPHLLTPPTDDKTVLRHYLQLVHPDLLPTEGSNLPAAIKFSASTFTSNLSARAVLLVSDGELPADNITTRRALENSVLRLQEQGIALYVLGIGTPEGATLLSPDGSWLQVQNKTVVSKLHEPRLNNLALLGHGRYATVSDTDAEWQTLYDQGIARLQISNISRQGNSLIVWREYYTWCLVPAVMFLFLAYWQPRRRTLPTAPLMLLLVLGLPGVVYPPPSQAATEAEQQRAWQAYHNQAYQEAKQLYARVDGYAGRLGEGNSAYRLGQYQEAVQLFTQAILDADNDLQRADALFNLANSQYQLESYAVAMKLYQDVLRYRPADQAAKINLKYSRALLRQQQLDDEKSGGMRPGRGPRTARLPDGTPITQGGLTLGDDIETPLPEEPPGPGMRPTPGSDLFNRGIHSARPAAPQVQEVEDTQWIYAATSPERIVLQASGLQVDESVLWQRIFETEEGFPAPLEQSRQVPGMQPW